MDGENSHKPMAMAAESPSKKRVKMEGNLPRGIEHARSKIGSLLDSVAHVYKSELDNLNKFKISSVTELEREWESEYLSLQSRFLSSRNSADDQENIMKSQMLEQLFQGLANKFDGELVDLFRQNDEIFEIESNRRLLDLQNNLQAANDELEKKNLESNLNDIESEESQLKKENLELKNKMKVLVERLESAKEKAGREHVAMLDLEKQNVLLKKQLFEHN